MANLNKKKALYSEKTENEGANSTLNPHKVKYVNEILQRRFDGISPDSN